MCVYYLHQGQRPRGCGNQIPERNLAKRMLHDILSLSGQTAYMSNYYSLAMRLAHKSVDLQNNS